MMSQELDELRALGEELALAEGSAWQPRCIARAFRTAHAGALVLTMQGWIDLDACRSPLLLDELPETLEQLGEAVDAWGIGPLEVDAEEALIIARRMREAVREAMAMQCGFEPPAGSRLSTLDSPLPDGCGDWLPIFACLVSQIGLSRAEALALPARQAFALIAGHRANQGWSPSGMTYAQRDVEKPEASDNG